MNSITFFKYALGILIILLSVGHSFAQDQFLGYSWTGGDITSVLDSTTGNFRGLSRSRNKSVYEHNCLGYPVAKINYIYSSIDGWLKRKRRTYDYDERGNLTAVTDYTWETVDSIWGPEYRQIYRYSDENKVIWRTGAFWCRDLEEFPLRSYYEYEYDDRGNMLSEILYSMDDADNFFASRSYIYHYNDNGLLELKTSTSASDKGITSAEDSATYAYNNKGQLSTYIQFSKPGADNLFYRIKYEYNDKGNILRMLHEHWAWNSKDWEFEREDLFNYDRRGNLLEKISNGKTHAVSDHYTYTYDRRIEARNIRILPEDIYDMGSSRAGSYSFSPKYKFPLIMAMNTYHMVWSNKIYYFSDWITLNTANIYDSPPSTLLFPNPVKRFLSIQNEIPEPVNLTLYDLTGRIVFSKLVDQKVSLDLENLKKGVYVYHLETSEAIKKGKIVKE